MTITGLTTNFKSAVLAGSRGLSDIRLFPSQRRRFSMRGPSQCSIARKRAAHTGLTFASTLLEPRGLMPGEPYTQTYTSLREVIGSRTRKLVYKAASLFWRNTRERIE